MNRTRSQPAASSQSSLRDKMPCAELTRAESDKDRGIQDGLWQDSQQVEGEWIEEGEPAWG